MIEPYLSKGEEEERRKKKLEMRKGKPIQYLPGLVMPARHI